MPYGLASEDWVRLVKGASDTDQDFHHCAWFICGDRAHVERAKMDRMKSFAASIRIMFLLFLLHTVYGKLFQNNSIHVNRTGRSLKRLSPSFFNRVNEFEEFALSYLDRHTRDYYNSGADTGQTLHENKNAFSKYRIRPRLLRDVSRRNLSVSLLGQSARIPFGVSPVAFQKMAHPDGEIATAKAVAAEGSVMILSMLATTSLEEVVKKSAGAIHWLQVYISPDRELTHHLVHKADVAGFKAIVVTIDSPVNGMWGVNMVHNLSLPQHLTLPNFQQNEVYRGNVGLRRRVGSVLLDPSLTWKNLEWLRTTTALPIVVKGILTAEDAVLAVEHGASAILVSNHGGRQLDGVPATLEALPEIVRAVRGRAEVYLDGGVRSGSDVFKALALGAKAVFFGRPLIWGLVHSGQEGVARIFNIMKSQFDTTMALSGAARLEDIKMSHVIRESYFDRLWEERMKESLR